MKYNKDNPLRCFFAFEGYNSQGLALNRLKRDFPDFNWVCVGRSEIDKYAIAAADALFPEAKDKNYGSITDIDWSQVPDFDCFTYSFPCFVKGTLIHTERGFIPIENVTVSDKVLTHTNQYQRVLAVGSRSGASIVKVRGSVDGVSPCLTEAMGMGGGQIPMVTEPSILGYTRDCKGNVESYHEKDMAGTIHTSSGSGGNTDQFIKECEPCGCYSKQFGEFAREPLEGVARTLKADHHNAVMLKYRIRKLTPTECFRLMGCDDSDIDKLKSAKLTQTLKSGKVKEKPIPKTQLYKMAGNSIVVDVLYHIFHQMFIAEQPKPKPIQKSLFD